MGNLQMFQFEKGDSLGTQFAASTYIRSTVYYDGYIYSIIKTTTTIKIYRSTLDQTTSDSLVYSYTVTSPYLIGNNAIIKVVYNPSTPTDYLCASWVEWEDDSGTFNFRHTDPYIVTTTNGTTWTPYTDSSAHSSDTNGNVSLVDCFCTNDGGNSHFTVVYTYKNNSSVSYIKIWTEGGSPMPTFDYWAIDFLSSNETLGVGGYLDRTNNSYYLIVNANTGNDWKIIYVGYDSSNHDYSTSVTDVSTLYWITDDDIAPSNAIYYVEDNVAFFLSKQYLQWYDKRTSTWSSIARSSGTYQNAVTWRYDSTLHRMCIDYVLFGQNIYTFYQGGFTKLYPEIIDASTHAYNGISLYSKTSTNYLYNIFNTSGTTGPLYSVLSESYLGTSLPIVKAELNAQKGTFVIEETAASNVWTVDDFIKFYAGNPTGTTTSLIFQGLVKNFEFKGFRTVNFEAAWMVDLNTRVNESYTTKTATYILEDIVSKYCYFLTSDIATGTDTYTISFKNKILKDVLKTLCQNEGWIWYVTPYQVLTVDDGTVDSGVDFAVDTTTSTGTKHSLYNVKYNHKMTKISQVELIGGTVSGERIKSIKIASQTGYGRYYDSYPEITSQSKLDTMASTILSDKNTSIIQVIFNCINSEFVQYGQQVDYQYTPDSDDESAFATLQKYYTNSVIYYPIIHGIKLGISDARMMSQGEGPNSDGIDPKNNNQGIEQNSGDLEEHINPTSSVKFKTNISDFESRDLLKLQPRNYAYKKSPNENKWGLIIEEVPEEFEELVIKNAKGEPKGINYHNLIIPLLSEVQNLRKELNTLKAKQNKKMFPRLKRKQKRKKDL